MTRPSSTHEAVRRLRDEIGPDLAIDAERAAEAIRSFGDTLRVAVDDALAEMAKNRARARAKAKVEFARRVEARRAERGIDQ